MVRVLFLVPTLDRSGAEKQLTMLVQAGHGRDFQALVVCLDRGGPLHEELRAAGVTVLVLGKRGKFDPAAVSRLRKIVNGWRPHIVHSWLFAGLIYSRLAGQAKRLHSLRCVDSWMGKPQKIASLIMGHSIDRFTANSQAVADWYRKLGLRPITVVPNGIEQPATHDGVAVRDELGLTEDDRVVAIVGRLAKQKRIRDLLWAFQLLRQTDERSRLLVIGDGPERADLERYAHDMECFERTTFLGHRNDVPRLLAAADAFWLGSDFEGQSNSLMEAMAAARPVVVSSIDANRELVTHKETGFLVDVGDAAGFAQFTGKLFADEQLAQRIGLAGQVSVLQSHSVATMTDGYRRLYEKLVPPESF